MEYIMFAGGFIAGLAAGGVMVVIWDYISTRLPRPATLCLNIWKKLCQLCRQEDNEYAEGYNDGVSDAIGVVLEEGSMKETRGKKRWS